MGQPFAGIADYVLEVMIKSVSKEGHQCCCTVRPFQFSAQSRTQIQIHSLQEVEESPGVTACVRRQTLL